VRLCSTGGGAGSWQLVRCDSHVIVHFTVGFIPHGCDCMGPRQAMLPLPAAGDTSWQGRTAGGGLTPNCPPNGDASFPKCPVVRPVQGFTAWGWAVKQGGPGVLTWWGSPRRRRTTRGDGLEAQGRGAPEQGRRTGAGGGRGWKGRRSPPGQGRRGRRGQSCSGLPWRGRVLGLALQGMEGLEKEW